jgi:hypothetical protein
VGVSYQAKVRLKGYPPQSATFDRKSEAVKWGEDVDHALLNGLPLPGEEIPHDDKNFQGSVEKRRLLGQCCGREFLRQSQN